MMRVVIDTNILISYLLARNADRAPNLVVRAAFARRFELTLNETTFQELANSVRSKPYLAARIDQVALASFDTTLRQIATITPEIAQRLPSVSRDPGDDYLIAHSVLEQVDYLITGGKDLLVLGVVAGVPIVSPADFVAILETETVS